MQTAHARLSRKRRALAPRAPGPSSALGRVLPAPQRDPQAERDYLRGLELAKRERWKDAADAYAAAVARNADDPVFWLNLAHAHVKLGNLGQAADAARSAVLIDPTSHLAMTIASQCLAAGNRHAETVELLRQVDLEPVKDPLAHYALGNALAALQRYREAIDAYLEALRRKPDFIDAHVQLANVFERMRLYLEARECVQTVIALGATQAGLRSAMVYHAQHACRWDLVKQDLPAMLADAEGGVAQPTPFHLLTMPSTRRQQLAAASAFWARHCAGVVAMSRPRARVPGSALRVGYVSNDVHRHATAYLIADLIESHDRQRCAVFLYSYGLDDGSAIRRRIMAAAGAGFVDAAQMSDNELADRIRADDIDILVDLKGYTQGTRPALFALHAARIQVNFLGYPGTLGSPCYEYIIGDRHVTPLQHAADYREHIAQMPHCYQPNDRHRPIGPRPTRAQCGLPPSAFVFCSFNNCYKITQPVFDRWCRLLLAVPGSVLWLYEANAQARPNLLREAQLRGVDPGRIVWAPEMDLAEHLGRLQLADLVLDTSPVNAHTTASDALWAGVPIVTTPGESFVARVASSIVDAAGLPELIAPDGDAYEALALALARDPQRLGALRARLAAQRLQCPLFDSAAYTRDLEDLYARMLSRWERGEAPAALPAVAHS